MFNRDSTVGSSGFSVWLLVTLVSCWFAVVLIAGVLVVCCWLDERQSVCLFAVKKKSLLFIWLVWFCAENQNVCCLDSERWRV